VRVWPGRGVKPKFSKKGPGSKKASSKNILRLSARGLKRPLTEKTAIPNKTTKKGLRIF